MPETEDGTQGLPQKPTPVRAPAPQADICYNLALAPSYQIGMEALRVHSGMFRPVNSMGGRWSPGVRRSRFESHHLVTSDRSWRLAFWSSVGERYGCADHNPDPLSGPAAWMGRPTGCTKAVCSAACAGGMKRLCAGWAVRHAIRVRASAPSTLKSISNHQPALHRNACAMLDCAMHARSLARPAGGDGFV
jgi:hypothetical protein